jgi:predicted TIM-barrel fold metal-dependent hydrolase
MGEIGSQLVGVPPNDPRLAAYFELAVEFGVPVLIHTEGIGPPLPGFRTAAGSPLLLEDVLVRHPDLKVFVENSGYPFLDEMTAMMYQYRNLYWRSVDHHLDHPPVRSFTATSTRSLAPASANG